MFHGCALVQLCVCDISFYVLHVCMYVSFVHLHDCILAIFVLVALIPKVHGKAIDSPPSILIYNQCGLPLSSISVSHCMYVHVYTCSTYIVSGVLIRIFAGAAFAAPETSLALQTFPWQSSFWHDNMFHTRASADAYEPRLLAGWAQLVSETVPSS